jgi:hypothetical protein
MLNSQLPLIRSIIRSNLFRKGFILLYVNSFGMVADKADAGGIAEFRS